MIIRVNYKELIVVYYILTISWDFFFSTEYRSWSCSAINLNWSLSVRHWSSSLLRINKASALLWSLRRRAEFCKRMQIMVTNVTLILRYPVSSYQPTKVGKTYIISLPIYLTFAWVNVMNGFPYHSKLPYHLLQPTSVTVSDLQMVDWYQQFGMPVRGSNIINSISEPSCNVICSGQNPWKLPQNGLGTKREVIQLNAKKILPFLMIIIEFMK